MRLPPPPRKYSPISVIAVTPETGVAAELALNGGEIVAKKLEDFSSVDGVRDGGRSQ